MTTAVREFHEHFDTDPTGDGGWVEEAGNPGLVQYGAMYARSLFIDDNPIFTGWAYKIPFAMPSGGRVGMKAVFSGEAPTSGLGFGESELGYFAGQKAILAIGHVSPATMIVTDSLILLYGYQGTTFESIPHDLDLSSGTWWFTLDSVLDSVLPPTVIGKIYDHEPTTFFSSDLDYNAALQVETDPPGALEVNPAGHFGGGGVVRESDEEIGSSDTHYDDLFAWTVDVFIDDNRLMCVC